MVNFNASDADVVKQLKQMGYENLIKINQKWCGLYRFAYTWGLVVGINAIGYERRYCYEKGSEAFENLLIWDGIEHPSGNWIKCKGNLNGEAVDFQNPNYVKD